MKRSQTPHFQRNKHSIVASINGHQPPSRKKIVKKYGFSSTDKLNEWIDDNFSEATKKELHSKLDSGDDAELLSARSNNVKKFNSNTRKNSEHEVTAGGTMDKLNNTTNNKAHSTEDTLQKIREISATMDELRNILSLLWDWRSDLYESLAFPCIIHPSYSGRIPKYGIIVNWEQSEIESLLDKRYNYINEDIRHFVNHAATAWLENEKTQIFVGDLSIQILLTSLGIPWNN